MDRLEIKITKNITDSSIYFISKFDYFHAYIDLLFLAEDENKRKFIRGIEINLEDNQIHVSKLLLSERRNLNYKTVIKYLKEIRKAGLIDFENSNLGTKITFSKENS